MKIKLFMLLLVVATSCKLGLDVSKPLKTDFDDFKYKRIEPGEFRLTSGQGFKSMGFQLPELNFITKFDGVCGVFDLDSNMYEAIPRNIVNGVQQTSKLSGYSNYLNPFYGTPHRIYSDRLGYNQDVSKPFHIVLGIYTDRDQAGAFKQCDTVYCNQKFKFWLSSTDSVRLYISKELFKDTLINKIKVKISNGWSKKRYVTVPAVEGSVIYQLNGYYGGSQSTNRKQSYRIHPIE